MKIRIAAAFCLLVVMLIFAWRGQKQKDAGFENSQQKFPSASEPVAGAQTPAKTRKVAANTVRPKNLHEFKGLYPGPWHVHKSEKKIFSISGGLIRAGLVNQKDALQFSRSLAAVFGVSADEIKPGDDSVQAAKSRVFTFVQRVNNYDVYQSYLSVAARSQDGAVFLINNNLRPLDHFESGFILSDEKLTEIVQGQNENFRAVHLANPEPVWFNTSGSTAVLARVFHAKHRDRRELEVIVNAQTGEFLYETAASIE